MTMPSKVKTPVPPEVMVLVSGGLDSAVCLDFYLDLGRPVGAFFVNYDQPARDQELNAAKEVSSHYGVPFFCVRWSGLVPKTVGKIPARNAFLLTAALMESSPTVTSIALGIHAGTAYSDCSPEFVRKMQGVFDIYTNGAIQVAAPVLDWTKQEIWTHAKSRKIPIHLTYSCEAGGDTPCGKCMSCQDRLAFA